MALHFTVAVISSYWPISFHLGSLLCVKCEWRISQLPAMQASPEKSALADAFSGLAWLAWPLVSAAADAPSFPPVASPVPLVLLLRPKAKLIFLIVRKRPARGRCATLRSGTPTASTTPPGPQTASRGQPGGIRRLTARVRERRLRHLGLGSGWGHGVHAHFLAQGRNMGVDTVEGMGGI